MKYRGEPTQLLVILENFSLQLPEPEDECFGERSESPGRSLVGKLVGLVGELG